MEPVTIVKVAETIQKVAEAAKRIQKIYNVSREVKSVAESEGKDQIQATCRVASSANKLPSKETKGLEKNGDLPSRLKSPRGWDDFSNSDMATLKEGSPYETLKERPSLFDEGLPLIDEKLPSLEVPSKGMTLDKGDINIFVEEMPSTGRELPKPKFSDETKSKSSFEDIRSSNTNIYDAIPQREIRPSTELTAERSSESNESEATDNHTQVQERPESQYSPETSEEQQKREGLINEQKKEIKEKTGWSDRIIDSIRTMDEAEIYMNAGLQEGEINGKPALLEPKIDGSAYNEPKWSDWSNKDLAEEGYPPRDETGKPYELHHIGQNPDSPLAELTHEQHHSNGNFKKLHTFDESSIDRQQFNQERKEYWKARSQTL